jgi:hypothetical protein
MSLEKQTEIMDLVYRAVCEMEAGDCAGPAQRLNDALWKLTDGPKRELLRLDAVNSSTVVRWAEGIRNPDEFLETVITHVLLDVPASVWDGWHNRHTIDSCLAHFCPDMEVLRALSGEHREAAINYALAIYTRKEYSAEKFEEFLASKREIPHVLKGIVLALRGAPPESTEKKAIHARYLASTPIQRRKRGLD